MALPETITTDRLVLRPWAEEDVVPLNLFCRDPCLGPAAGWAPHGSLAESARVLREILMVPGTYAITLAASGGVVGCISAGEAYEAMGVPVGEPVIGYWVGVPFQNRGIASEACRALVGACLAEEGAERVWAGHTAENEASAAVLEKSGFTDDHRAQGVPCPVGGTRDLQMMSIDRDGWERLKANEAMERAMAQARMGMMGAAAAGGLGATGELDEP